MKRPNANEQLRKGIYIIPSLFTVANIFCGFLSVIEGSRGHMERAAVLILVAVVADMLDGRIARLTGSTSSFGEVYDSLADIVSFGMAPAVLAYHWGLWDIPDIGMATSFLFLVAGSIRLARFSSGTHDPGTFNGLPIPAGASAISMLVLISPTPVSHPFFIPVVVAFVLALSLLMVSNLPYKSFKDVNLKKRWPAPTVFAIALIFSLIKSTPHVLSVLLGIYILSAPFSVLNTRMRRKSVVDAESPAPEEPHHEQDSSR